MEEFFACEVLLHLGFSFLVESFAFLFGSGRFCGVTEVGFVVSLDRELCIFPPPLESVAAAAFQVVV